jgi:Flp pilus assembly protein TadG
MTGANHPRSSTGFVERVATEDRLAACRDERGSVLVLSAVLIPVFVLLTALVVDVGSWYTHKRQLQNRADAAAFAAGTGYAQNWKACIQSGDATLRANTARKIANVARTYAADPEAADYAPDALPGTLYNANIATQSKLDVVVNSTTYDDDTDYSDGGGSPPLGNPCFVHSGDAISPGGGHWVDVRVKENDLPSLFGSVGIPLRRNVARARIEIRPALSGNRFLPLAVPNNVISKVQVRYYNECTSPPTLIPNSTFDLKPLPAADQAAFVSAGGGILWGLESLTTPGVGDSGRSLPITLPTYGGCQQPYLPVGMEVRLTSTDSVDINQSCQALITAKFADCFHRLSQIRVWNDGVAPRTRNVTLTGGCGLGDAYFGPLPTAATDCRFGANVDVFWGTMDDNELAVSSNFHVTVNGVNASPPGPTTPSGVWTVPSTALTASAGANDVTVQISWTDTNNAHNWEQGGGQCRNGGQNPCRYSGPSEAVHRTFVGTKNTAGAVAMAHTSTSGFVGGVPGPSYATVADGGNVIDVHPTVGIQSVLKAGVFTILRLDDPQANQTLECDPDYAQGQEFSAFQYGCKPWYAANSFTNGPWWNTTTRQCPDGGLWFSNNTMPAPYGKNSSANPWRCVLTAPGMSTGQVGDDIAVATDNCTNINNNSCQQFACVNDGNYDGKAGNPSGWIQRGGDSRYPRVVNLFIVPYQGSKGLSGAGDTIPVLGFASFYVMNWTGSNNNQSDRCPDTTFDHDHNPLTPQINVPSPPAGAISGVFVETVDYEPGPVDATAVCVEGQLTPCRATLVR